MLIMPVSLHWMISRKYEELYARLLEEFPKWLEEIRKKGMI